MNILIIGGGQVGSYMANLLIGAGHRVRVIEQRPTTLEHLHRDLPAEVVVTGNGTNPALLEQTGIRQVDLVAAVTGADETNLVVTSLARFEFGVARTIARINNPKNAWMFTPEMGVDRSISQADQLARLIIAQM